MDQKTDPIITDLIRWLHENLPADTDEEAVFKKVKRVQRVFDTLMGLAFQEFYNQALNVQSVKSAEVNSLEEIVNDRLAEMPEYVGLNEEKILRTQKLDASRAKLDLKREQYKLITSIRLDSCLDLKSRYNHLMSKK